MELEEAIDILKNGICDYVIPSYCKDCENKTECLDDCNFILAIYTVLQELEHLQKKNEEYSKQMNLDYVDKNFVSREKIENKIKEYFEYDKKHKTYTSDGRENYTYEYYKALTLQDLLREE